MTESLPEPLMLNGEPHYTALQIAEMRLPGMPGTERGIQLLAARHGWPRRRRSGCGGREGVSAQSPAGRGASENPPTRTAQTHATRPCGLSLHPEEDERQKAPLSRPRAGSEGDGRGEGRGGRAVETIQTEPPQRGIHPRGPQGFLHTLEGRPRRGGGAGAQSLTGVRRPPPCTDGTRLWRGAV